MLIGNGYQRGFAEIGDLFLLRGIACGGGFHVRNYGKNDEAALLARDDEILSRVCTVCVFAGCKAAKYHLAIDKLRNPARCELPLADFGVLGGNCARHIDPFHGAVLLDNAHEAVCFLGFPGGAVAYQLWSKF